MNIVLFDFCNTLVDFETANEFVRYIIRREGSKSILAENIREVISNLHLLSFINRFHKSISVNKALWLYQLRGMNRREIEKYAYLFYSEIIKSRLIMPVVDSLISYKREGCKIIVVSGGYDTYIRYFASDYDVDLICTNLMYNNNVFSGKILGRDCIKDEKVERVKEYLKNERINNCIFVSGYTDSESDIPMLSLCKVKNVVIKKDNIVPIWSQTIKANHIFY